MKTLFTLLLSLTLSSTAFAGIEVRCSSTNDSSKTLALDVSASETLLTQSSFLSSSPLRFRMIETRDGNRIYSGSDTSFFVSHEIEEDEEGETHLLEKVELYDIPLELTLHLDLDARKMENPRFEVTLKGENSSSRFNCSR
jgi:hypothetical protein